MLRRMRSVTMGQGRAASIAQVTPRFDFAPTAQLPLEAKSPTYRVSRLELFRQQ